MQSIDHLIDEVATYISERNQGTGQFYFSEIDLKSAYSKCRWTPTYKNTAILGGKASGTYHFINVFYGLTYMPTTFQKTIDKTLESVLSKFAFLDDILIITKGSLNSHKKEFEKS